MSHSARLWLALTKPLVKTRFTGAVAVLTYRLAASARRLRIPILWQVLLLLVVILRRALYIVIGVEISPKAEIGPGLVVHTTHGVFIAETRIGRNCVVQHGVAITHGVRSVGDNVYFGPGAKVIGRAAIGNNVRGAQGEPHLCRAGDALQSARQPPA